MSKKSLVLNFYGFEVIVESNCSKALERLSSDFSFFKFKSIKKLSIHIEVFLELPDMSVVTGDKFFKNTKVEVFDKYPLRYSIYGKEGLSIWNQEKEDISIFASELDLLHELTYLFILSRVGKLLDLEGFHRIHGSCLTVGDTLVLGMMSSGVGKSTLAAFLLEYPDVSIYSDDSPLITPAGEVQPFALRFGFEEDGLLPNSWANFDSYSLKRRHYGQKKLFSLEVLNSSIGGKYKEKVILLGRRSSSIAKPFIIKRHRVFSFGHIFREGVVGIGLPILVEYFWQKGLWDFCLKTKIFFSRIRAFLNLLRTSEVYEIVLTDDPEQNVEYLVQWCKTRKGT